MKIGINATHLNEEPTGIGVVTREVARNLYRLHRNVLTFTSLPGNSLAAGPVFRVPASTRGSKKLKNNLLRAVYLNTVLPLQARRSRIDVLYCPILEFPRFPLSPLVVTVHDLQPLAYPSQFGLSVHYFRYCLNRLSRVAARVTVVSGFVRKELLAATDLREELIDVIPNGYDAALFRPQDPALRDAFLSKYSLGGRYILYVGTLFPYKNVGLLADAFLGIADRLDHRLVIVGRRSPGDEILPRSDRIRYMDYVAHGDLPKFYAYADMLVHPSLSEGFGLTPLEAMACGTPVLASCRASLPEVVGDAGILFDPTDAGELGSLILKVASDKSLRAGMRERGLKRAGDFSWEKMAAGILESCRKAARGKASKAA